MVILSRVFTWLQENGSSHVSFSDKTNHLPLHFSKKAQRNKFFAL
jgi:hypothetical protein